MCVYVLIAELDDEVGVEKSCSEARGFLPDRPNLNFYHIDTEATDWLHEIETTDLFCESGAALSPSFPVKLP